MTTGGSWTLARGRMHLVDAAPPGRARAAPVHAATPPQPSAPSVGLETNTHSQRGVRRGQLAMENESGHVAVTWKLRQKRNYYLSLLPTAH